LQETGLVLWRKWDQFDRSREFLPWACGIARLQVLRFVREHRAKGQFLDEKVMNELADVAEEKIQHMTRVETRIESLKKCIEELDEPNRRLVEDRYFKSISTKQIAEQSGKPAVTIYKILARARVQLMNCMKRRLAALEPGQ